MNRRASAMPFEMDQDRAGREVEGQIVEDVAELDSRRSRPGRRCARSRSAARAAQSSMADGDRVRLGDEGEIARGRQGVAAPVLSCRAGHDHADPVRADHAHAGAGGRAAHRARLLGVERGGAGAAADQADRPAAARRPARRAGRAGRPAAGRPRARQGSGRQRRRDRRGAPRRVPARCCAARWIAPAKPASQRLASAIAAQRAPVAAGPTQRMRSGSNRWRRLRTLMSSPSQSMPSAIRGSS